MAAPDARLKALFTEHYDFVWRSARRLGVPDGSVDDAAQEVFLVASRKLEQIRAGSEKAFLFGIAMRIASDARRAIARRPVDSDDAAAEAMETYVDPAPTPEALADKRRARALLDQVIDSMPMDVRAVFVLFELEGMTMAEIAAAVDVPAGTVASRLRRGRELFQERVKRLSAGGAR